MPREHRKAGGASFTENMIQGPREASEAIFWPKNDRFWPPPANPVQLFWLKMPSKCVPWIVVQVSCSTRTSRESLRPPKRPSKAKNGQNFTFLDISGSVLSNFEVFPRSCMKYEKNAAFGSHLALSVLQIRLGQPGRSPSVHHYRLTETLPSSLSHHFFSDFLVVNHSGKINGTY